MHMKKFLLIACLLPSWASAQDIFDNFNDFLSTHVVFGLVDYEAIQSNQKQLQTLVDQIASYNVKDFTENHQSAFYINAYNLLVIKQIADNYPIKSPMDIDEFFKITTFTVAGETLTLDEIEFQKLIAPTEDPRIHFALGCGARSCPFLFNKAFTPTQLQDQLEFRAKQIIERPSYVFVDDNSRTVTFNKIFDWYGDQFIASAGSLIRYVNQYKEKKVPEVYKIKFQEYDWSLNDR